VAFSVEKLIGLLISRIRLLKKLKMITVIVIPLPQLPGMVTIYSNMNIKSHDGSRFSCKVLLSQARDVLSKFSDKGLCYYILHHYLDKFMNILTDQLLNIYSRVKEHETRLT